MKRFSVVLGLALWAVVVLGMGVAHGQPTGSIVGWGRQIVVEQAALDSLITVAAGYGHSLGLKSDGTIVAWGHNWNGQCNVSAPNEDFIAVAAGYGHSLGVKSDGTIVAWGGNAYGQCDVPAPNEDFIAVAGGCSHSLGLKSDGTIVAWGDNYYGQCDVPAPNEDFIAVAGGYKHSLGLKSDGTIVAWGWNDSSQCDVPAPNEDFIAVAGGRDHSLGLKSDGTIVAWGGNAYGQCDVPAPNEDFITVAGGWYHSLGLKSDSTIVAWGRNNHGQCNVPAPNEDFIAVAGGCSHSLGLKSDGTIVAWGDNYYGQCNVPAPNEDFIAVAEGGLHSLGLKSNSTIVAWGWNDHGQCDVPAPNEDFIAVAGGYYHSLGLKSDGTIVAWGWNDHGQCDAPAPNEDFIAVAGGGNCNFGGHSLGLKSDGTIVAWGDNYYGQCDVPAPNEDFIAVAGGAVHSLGLKSDGTIVAWGDNGDGQCDVPVPNEDFIAVAGGDCHSLGLKSDSTIVAWGDNWLGQCDVPTPNEDFIAVAGGEDHSLGLKKGAPECEVNPAGLDFGRVFVGDWKDSTFTIKNTGGGSLTGTVSESCDHYSIVSGEGAYSLAADESLLVTVRFEPSSAGAHNCTIETGSALCSNVSCTGIGAYDVTIDAYCYTESVAVSVSITMDGSPTGYNTPHTFTSLTDTHTFTVPGVDPHGHPFNQWDTGETDTTITVTTGGTYTANYISPYIPGDVNGDGTVDEDDASSLVSYLYGGGEGPPYWQGAADVNEDGYVDISDGVWICYDILPKAAVGKDKIFTLFNQDYGKLKVVCSGPRDPGEIMHVVIVAEAENNPVEAIGIEELLYPACLTPVGVSFYAEAAQADTVGWSYETTDSVSCEDSNTFRLGILFSLECDSTKYLSPGPEKSIAQIDFQIREDASLGAYPVSVPEHKGMFSVLHGSRHEPAIEIVDSVRVGVYPQEESSSLPKTFALAQNYPNPFNPTTQIRYELPVDCQVRLEVYNVAGQEVATLVEEGQKAGYKTAKWDAGSLSSGIYFYRLQAGDFVQTRKMILIR